MNLNIQKAKIFVEERLAIVQYAGTWSEVKTRYGTSLLYTNDRWPEGGVSLRNFKVSFNGKSITIAELFRGKWVQVIELDEKTCKDLARITDVLLNFTPNLTGTDAERAQRRVHEAYRDLTGAVSGDVAVTVSAGNDKAPEGTSEPVQPPSTKGRDKFLAGKKSAPVERKEIVIEDAGTAVVEGKEIPVVKFSESEVPKSELLESGDMNFSPANHEQSVSRAKRESPHKIAMVKLVEESGIPFTTEPSQFGISYLFEGISFTFSGTMLKVVALTEWDDGKDRKPFPVFCTWLSGKYEHDQIALIVKVLAIAKEAARLRTMACFSMPEISFSHSETNFITDAKEPVHYRTRCTYISINYRIEGLNHDGFEMSRPKSIRYTLEEITSDDPRKRLAEKVLTASVSYSKPNDTWGDRYYNAKNPTKRMSIEAEEVSYTTNRDLLVSYGLKISAERRYKEYYIVNVPLDKVPAKNEKVS